MRYIALLALLAGCSVVDAPYPAAWDPLLPSPSGHCRRFEGTYADRGETTGQPAQPSLTRELFGESSPWAKATSLRFDLASDDTVEVTVSSEGARPLTRRFSAKAGDFKCQGGKLTLHSQRWVTSDLMSGRESVKVDLHGADPYLVAHVHETATGVMFLVVPLSGESVRWFRFPRLKP